MASGLAPVRRGMGIHLFLSAPSSMLVGMSFSCAEPLGFLRILFAPNVEDVGSALFVTSGSLLFRRWISFSVRPVSRLGLIPQPFLETFVVFFLQSFTNGQGLNPQSLDAAFPPFSFGENGFKPPEECFLHVLE